MNAMILRPSYKTSRKATVVGKNAQVDAVLQDISLDYAGILTPRGAAIGTELELIFEIPANGEFVTLNIPTVVTHRHNVAGEIYLKLKYLLPSHHELATIQAFLEYKQRLINMGKKPEMFE